MAEQPDSGPPPVAVPSVFRLLDLPNEIIKSICDDDEFEVKDLKALRLTNKLLCEIVTKRFAMESFREITVLMSRSSLKAFCELSQHPLLGPVVEEVNISPMFVPHDGIESLPTPTMHEDVDAEQQMQRARTLQNARKFLNRMCEERETKTFGCAQRMLSIAFKAFALRGQWIFLKFWNNEENAIGANHLLLNEDLGSRAFWHVDWQKTLESTIKAAFNQGCKIDGLLFCCDDYRQNYMNVTGLCTDGIGQPLDILCSHLTHLEIEFEHPDYESTLRSVKRMVSVACNLKVLRLYELGDDQNVMRRQYLRDILKYVASSSLQCIEFGLFMMPESELFTFLKRYSETLVELKLLHVCLYTGNCISLIAWIKENLRYLLHFHLDQFCQHGELNCCHEDDYAEEYLVDYDENMQACLADILDGKRKARKVEE